MICLGYIRCKSWWWWWKQRARAKVEKRKCPSYLILSQNAGCVYVCRRRQVFFLFRQVILENQIQMSCAKSGGLGKRFHNYHLIERDDSHTIETADETKKKKMIMNSRANLRCHFVRNNTHGKTSLKTYRMTDARMIVINLSFILFSSLLLLFSFSLAHTLSHLHI